MSTPNGREDAPETRKSGGIARRTGLRSWRRAAVRLAVGFVVPPLLYAVVRPAVGGDIPALVVAAAVPAAWTVGALVLLRRLDRVAVLSLATLGVAIAVSLVSGSDALLKVREAPITGAVGLALLVSAVVGRPLLPPLLRLLGRSTDGWSSRRSIVPTAVIGATLLLDAVVRIALALTLDTGTFLPLGRLAGWGILGAGLLVLIALRRRRIGRPRPEASAGPVDG